MITKRLMALLLLLAGAVPAHSACDPGKVEPREPISVQALERRNNAFRVMCERNAGRLVDADDTGYGGRLSYPTDAKTPNFRHLLVDEDFRKAKSVAVTLAAVVEEDGRVSWVSVIESTGNEKMDVKLGQLFMATTFATPATLDGEKVRVFFATPMRFRLDK